MAETIPYAGAETRKRSPIRRLLGATAVVLGAAAFASMALSYLLRFWRDESLRAEPYAAVGLVLAICGVVAAACDLPRISAIVGLCLALAALLAYAAAGWL